MKSLRKTIRFYCPSAESRGVRVAETTTRMVQAVVALRAKFDEALGRPEPGDAGLSPPRPVGGRRHPGARHSSRRAWDRTMCNDTGARNLPMQAIYRKLGHVQGSALGTRVCVIRKHM